MSEVSLDAGPYDLVPEGCDGRVAALCLHGLTGTPYEVRPIAEALASRGVRARGPALPGHDATPEDLRGVLYTDWLAAARSELEMLRADGASTVLVAGLSMGGVVSLMLASEGLVDGIAVVGTPLALRPAPLVALVPIAKHVHRYLPKREGSDIQDPVARARHPSYEKMPLASIHELMRMQKRVRLVLHKIIAPILVAHGAFDRTASPKDAHRIAGEVSSDIRRLLLLPRSGHVVPVDNDGARLSKEIADFFLPLASRACC